MDIFSRIAVALRARCHHIRDVQVYFVPSACMRPLNGMLIAACNPMLCLNCGFRFFDARTLLTTSEICFTQGAVTDDLAGSLERFQVRPARACTVRYDSPYDSPTL